MNIIQIAKRKMMEKKIKKIIIIICLIIFYCTNTYSQNINGEDIWFGFATNEFDGMSYGAVANDIDDEKLKISGYGRYQFKYNTNLVDFLQFADSEYFKEWIEIGKGSERLNKYEDGLPQAFTDYYVNNTDSFKEKQDMYIYNNYYVPLLNIFAQSGLDLKSRSSFVKGAILSIVIHRFNNNEISQTISRSSISDIINLWNADDKTYISKLYDMMIERYADEDTKKRFSKEKQECLEEKDDTFDSHIGEILNKYGKTNSATFIRELNNLNPTIFSEFLRNEKFSKQDTLEWYEAVRTSVDLQKEFGITSGVLDFGTATSHGINIDAYLDLIEDEVVFNIPNNGSNTYYIPQNTNKASYSELKFGINNIAQGGASLACMSMAVSKLTGNLIYPDEIYNKIVEKYGDYNYFYDTEKRGNRNEIINDIAGYYSLKSNIISGNSVINSLLRGNVVVARVSESEFTKYGTFILLCTVKEHNGLNYIVVADPNIYHTRYLYNLYSIDYLANSCNGIFFEIGR